MDRKTRTNSEKFIWRGKKHTNWLLAGERKTIILHMFFTNACFGSLKYQLLWYISMV